MYKVTASLARTTMGPPSPSSSRKEGDPAFRHPCTYRARRRSPTHPLVPVPLTVIHAAEVAIIRRPYDSTAWHRSSRWEATYSIRELGFNQFRLNHIAWVLQRFVATLTACSCPFRLSISGKPLTHRPPSESILAARGIQACVTRRTRQVTLRATYHRASGDAHQRDVREDEEVPRFLRFTGQVSLIPCCCFHAS